MEHSRCRDQVIISIQHVLFLFHLRFAAAAADVAGNMDILRSTAQAHERITFVCMQSCV